MRGIVLSEDELKTLEKHFGPVVRKMGQWNSDGTFGYSWIPMEVLEKAAESVDDPAIRIALSRLNSATEPNAAFTALLESSGNSLVDRIVTAYNQRDLELESGTRLAQAPLEQTPGRRAAAAG